jgi:TetR/AcrR family transcriptional regulator, regulator of autoinduction and epiphytic fitness
MSVAPVADGRAARKAATRDAIADALLDLVTEGHLRPTAREIAARAGISLRSVYVHFDDLEDLFCVAARRQFDRVAPMLAPATEDGTLPQRAEAVVRRRAQLFDQFGPIRHATELQAPFSPTLRRLVTNAHAHGRRELERVFATELHAMPAAERNRALATVDALTSGATWDLVREHQGMSASEAERAMIAAVMALLGTGV